MAMCLYKLIFNLTSIHCMLAFCIIFCNLSNVYSYTFLVGSRLFSLLSSSVGLLPLFASLRLRLLLSLLPLFASLRLLLPLSLPPLFASLRLLLLLSLPLLPPLLLPPLFSSLRLLLLLSLPLLLPLLLLLLPLHPLYSLFCFGPIYC
jgi:hypothetical protein